MTTTIGVLAAICSTFAFLPQVLKTWQTRRAEDISVLMYLVIVVGASLWLIYGIRLQQWPIIVSNIVTLLCSFSVLGMTLTYKVRPSQVEK